MKGGGSFKTRTALASQKLKLDQMNLNWLLLMRRSSGSTPSSSQMTELLPLSNPWMKLISSTWIQDLVLWVLIQTSGPQADAPGIILKPLHNVTMVILGIYGLFSAFQCVFATFSFILLLVQIFLHILIWNHWPLFLPSDRFASALTHFSHINVVFSHIFLWIWYS